MPAGIGNIIKVGRCYCDLSRLVIVVVESANQQEPMV